MKEDEPIIIRKHPLVVLRNLFVLEVGTIVGFYIVASFAHYEKLYSEHKLPQFLSFRFAELLFISLGEIIIVAFIFLWWFFETYEFIPSGVVHKRGIVFKTKSIVTFSSSFTVSVFRNPISRLFRYGTLIIQDGLSQQALRLQYVTNPDHYVNLLQDKVVTLVMPNGIKSVPIFELIKRRESEVFECKSTLRYDVRAGKTNKDLEHSVLKTIAAFLNSKGGHLLIGVDDSGGVLGLESDYKTLKKQNSDGFEAHLTMIFNKAIGAEFRDLITIEFEEVDKKEIAVVMVHASPKPTYVISDVDEHFFIRTGNATTDLTFRKAASYIESHWPRK